MVDKYVPFKLVKSLVDKGFSGSTPFLYDNNGYMVNHTYTSGISYPCPTYDMVLDWLRTKKKIEVSVLPIDFQAKTYAYIIHVVNKESESDTLQYKRYETGIVKGYYHALNSALRIIIGKLLPKK